MLTRQSWAWRIIKWSIDRYDPSSTFRWKWQTKRFHHHEEKKKKTENFFFVRFVNRTNRFLLFSSFIFKSIWNKNFYRIINLSTIDKTFVRINERLFSFSLQRESHQWRFNVVYRKWRTRWSFIDLKISDQTLQMKTSIVIYYSKILCKHVQLHDEHALNFCLTRQKIIIMRTRAKVRVKKLSFFSDVWRWVWKKICIISFGTVFLSTDEIHWSIFVVWPILLVEFGNREDNTLCRSMPRPRKCLEFHYSNRMTLSIISKRTGNEKLNGSPNWKKTSEPRIWISTSTKIPIQSD